MCSDFSLALSLPRFFFFSFSPVTHSYLTLTASFIPSAFESLPPPLLLRNSHSALQSGLNNPSFKYPKVRTPDTSPRSGSWGLLFIFLFFISYLRPPFFFQVLWGGGRFFFLDHSVQNKLATGGKWGSIDWHKDEHNALIPHPKNVNA